MIAKPILLVVAVACGAATLTWARSARRLERVWIRISEDGSPETEAAVLARSAFRKELHTVVLYGVLAISSAASSLSNDPVIDRAFALILVPVAVSIAFGRDFVNEARIAEARATLERRAEEVLSQDDLAPRRWAARLAPDDLPDIDGIDVSTVYQAGAGMMAGDFLDLFRTGPGRLAVVIGDVAGHGIEPSITAFQAKSLLRVFLRQFRDPGQALEELNTVLVAAGRDEEFVSLFVACIDLESGTMRHASAGHPVMWLFAEGQTRPMRSTGPLLTLNPQASYASFETPFGRDDLIVLYTDGLSEARNGANLFGEERVANIVKKDPSIATERVCRTLLDAARDFSNGALTDDLAIVALRRTA